MARKEDKKKPPLIDSKLGLAFEATKRLKEAQPAFQELLRCAERYQKQLDASNTAAKEFSDSLSAIGHLLQGDLGQGLLQFAFELKTVVTRMEQFSNAVQQKLIVPMEKTLDDCNKGLCALRRDIKKDQTRATSELKKLETQTKQSGKESAWKLSQNIATLTNKLVEYEDTQSARLRAAILLERRFLCAILRHLLAMTAEQADTYERAKDILNSSSQYWQELLSSENEIPPSLLEVLKVPTKRTLVPLPSADSSTEGKGAGVGSKVRALYDYVASQPDELTLRQGDIITIVHEEPNAAWWYGESKGVVGLFPANYVERMAQ